MMMSIDKCVSFGELNSHKTTTTTTTTKKGNKLFRKRITPNECTHNK